MAELNRNLIAAEIQTRLRTERNRLSEQWERSAPINHFVLDDLLPESWAREIFHSFPRPETMRLRRSLRELKYVSAQLDQYAPLLEEPIYAFQDPSVVKLVEDITQLKALEPDDMLYAGGISMMARGHFLNPHIDNSHDKFRERYRVLNLLYYVSPDRTEAAGCNLELWPAGPTGEPITIWSRFNRLVIMVTHQGSWHSVSANASTASRCCLSNYYFSREPVGGHDYFHITSFRGRPEQRLRDAALRADIWMRTTIRRFFPKGVRQSSHFYKKPRNGR